LLVAHFSSSSSAIPRLTQVVVEELSRNVTKSSKQLRTVGLAATARERLANLLLEWSEGGQATTSGSSRFGFSMTHQDIAEFIGASRETVTRTLSSSKRRQLVAFQGSMLTIPSRIALANYAQTRACCDTRFL
jgi:CRP/FNR family transcriptional regulator